MPAGIRNCVTLDPLAIDAWSTGPGRDVISSQARRRAQIPRDPGRHNSSRQHTPHIYLVYTNNSIGERYLNNPHRTGRVVRDIVLS